MKIPTMAQRLAERERPEGAPVMRQRWARLLFLHWAWDPAAIQATLPPGLTVDLHEGRAWVGVVPLLIGDRILSGRLFGIVPVSYGGRGRWRVGGGPDAWRSRSRRRLAES